MTPDAAIHEGMKAVDKVMGDVLAMTPIEREFLTRAMPFWSWTKHILKYVMTFPNDHPYRAMFLTQQSRIIQQEQPAGLPIRAELLFFLGPMNPSGQVNAIDVGGPPTLFGILATTSPSPGGCGPSTRSSPHRSPTSTRTSPSAPMSSIPMSSTRTSTARMKPPHPVLSHNAAEQIIPELTAADAALNLSGQFNYLHQAGRREQLASKVYSALNISFLQDQPSTYERLLLLRK